MSFMWKVLGSAAVDSQLLKGRVTEVFTPGPEFRIGAGTGISDPYSSVLNIINM